MTDPLKTFTDALDANRYSYTVTDGRVTVTERGHVYLPSLTALPEGTVFQNGGSVDLPSLTALPEGVVFQNGGGVYLSRLTALPEGTVFKNGGGVYLPSLTALPEGVVFQNGGGVYLYSLTALPEGVVFQNGGGVYLYSLTALPEGVVFQNGGGVYLPSLTALPEGVVFQNGGDVYLSRLPAGEYRYQGKTVWLEHIDGYTMILGRPRTIDGYQVYRARYFGGGPIEKLKQCYIARQGDWTAHGATAAEAIRDCRFKAAQANFDPTELARTIRERGTVTQDDFRLITGACLEGLRHGMAEAGLDPDAEELPLAVVLDKAHGSFGKRFRDVMENV